MKHLKLESIIEKRLEKITAAFETARLHFHENDIRLFRVKMKKLAACLELINGDSDDGNRFKRSPQLLRLNRLFGEIRTLQLQQDHVLTTMEEKQLGTPAVYLNFISDQIADYVAKINGILKYQLPFKKEHASLLKALPQQLHREAILRFVHAEGGKIEKLLMPVFPADKSLHEARKHLKNLLYISPYIHLEMAAISPFNSLSSFEDVNTFTKLLGGFHDLDTALNCLHHTVQKIEPDDAEKAILRQLEQAWLTGKEILRGQIYDELREILAAGRTAEKQVAWPVM